MLKTTIISKALQAHGEELLYCRSQSPSTLGYSLDHFELWLLDYRNYLRRRARRIANAVEKVYKNPSLADRVRALC